MKPKKERGITLVALVITIIILVILAAVTIRAVFKNRIIDIAIEGVENYAEGQYKEIDELEEISNKIDEAIKDIDKLGVSGVPKIEIEDKDTWTKGPKTVTISRQEGYETKYTLDGTKPSKDNGQTYENPLTIENNCEIKAIYINEDGKEGKITSEKIEKIDRNSPTKLEIKLTPRKNDSASGYSGIRRCDSNTNRRTKWNSRI